MYWQKKLCFGVYWQKNLCIGNFVNLKTTPRRGLGGCLSRHCTQLRTVGKEILKLWTRMWLTPFIEPFRIIWPSGHPHGHFWTAHVKMNWWNWWKMPGPECVCLFVWAGNVPNFLGVEPTIQSGHGDNLMVAFFPVVENLGENIQSLLKILKLQLFLWWKWWKDYEFCFEQHDSSFPAKFPKLRPKTALRYSIPL